MRATTHAVVRFAERIRGGNLATIREQLEGIAEAAVLEREEEGKRLLRAGDLRLVVVDDYILTCHWCKGGVYGCNSRDVRR